MRQPTAREDRHRESSRRTFERAIRVGDEAASGLKSTADDMLSDIRWQIDETDPAVRLPREWVWTAKGTVFGDQGAFGIGLNWQLAELSGRRVIF